MAWNIGITQAFGWDIGVTQRSRYRDAVLAAWAVMRRRLVQRANL